MADGLPLIVWRLIHFDGSPDEGSLLFVTRTFSRLCFSTDRSQVCLFEPTKRSAMHEIVRASFPSAFSLCGGWLGERAGDVLSA